MAIRLGHNCSNCENLKANDMCAIHQVEVDSHYTCDRFELKAELADKRECTTCVRYQTDNCAHPDKAAPGMMCASWAPQRVGA